jgi:hypothetical protein
MIKNVTSYWMGTHKIVSKRVLQRRQTSLVRKKTESYDLVQVTSTWTMNSIEKGY